RTPELPVGKSARSDLVVGFYIPVYYLPLEQGTFPLSAPRGAAPNVSAILAGTDVTLNCFFKKPERVPLEKITVEWGMMVDKETIKHLVYTFQNESAKVHREGSQVDQTGLLQGNASLRLFNMTVADEGFYRCRVIITPNTYKVSSQLEVSARPSVSLPETATVMEGQERTLMCDITGFYPENLAVTWLIQNGSRVARGSMARGAISRDVCTGMAVPNPDGTYSVSSHITVQASAVGSGGAMYICHIEHRSYPDGKYSKSILLTVQGGNQGKSDLCSNTLFALLGLFYWFHYNRKMGFKMVKKRQENKN
uniref:Ig-like domain-containing protein n=1 Tax=Salmo trutta TaxID=8032 RepID=A0A674BNH8_SALTR